MHKVSVVDWHSVWRGILYTGWSCLCWPSLTLTVVWLRSATSLRLQEGT